jgi:protein-tyrosine phosphatase
VSSRSTRQDYLRIGRRPPIRQGHARARAGTLVRMPDDRRLAWDGLANARDLGGSPTSDGRAVRWGTLIRSDSLASLTPAGRDALVAYGVRTVVDLRMPMEVEGDPNPFAVAGDHGIAYHNVSIIDPAAGPPPADVVTLAEDYRRMLARFGPQVAAVVTTVATAGEGGVLVHCYAGKDRTGLVVALLLGAIGVAPEVIADDYARTADALRAQEQRWLDDGPGPRAEREATLERVRARPEVMLEVLAHLDERYGGAAGYLATVGVAPGHVDRLRDRFLERPRNEAAPKALPDGEALP